MKIHFLDKIKYELNKKNPYQYFYQFWQYDSLFDQRQLDESIKKVYHIHPKLRHQMVENNGEYCFKPTFFDSVLFAIHTESLELEQQVDHFMTHDSNDYIKKANEAPFILIYIYNDNRSVLLFLHNHIYYDGYSGHQMVKHFWNCFYNENIDPIELEWLNDQEILERLKTQNKNFNALYYFQTLAKYAFRSSKITSNKNIVKKIYQSNQPSKVHFQHFYVNRRDFVKGAQKYSSNTIICALIAELFLSKKGYLTDNTIAISIPWNIRVRENKNLGNCVSSISVKLQKDQSFNQKCQTIHEAVNTFKDPLYSRASFHLSCVITKNKTQEDLLKLFLKISRKHHCYISNHGRHETAEQHPNLISSGGFNYPLQEDYGLVFTITPNKDEYCIGIASSNQIFSQEELKNFKFESAKSMAKCN